MQSSPLITTESEHLSITDRIESFKAGFLGAIASIFAFFAIAILHHLLVQTLQPVLTNSPTQLIDSFALARPLLLAIKLSMMGFAGFLFAVTYRYIVRHDRNSHLKSGAILAFACIRSFATIERELSWLMPLPLMQITLAIAILLLENIAWFAIVQNILETAIQHKWIAAFGSK
ncbi:hypothetical protein [Pseudanabaena sp. UWO310]|uniref:hypothetical protein n=1 Tax=Pseudanabaena sp. UWO310 TaxID=2480795 RepID=UPI00115B01E9|nr:hypothetical protein [Pseudanabaena sp. UWO310]TYQ26391.1 hypothetical protein PseudUWO310_17325 [Pseudanabaena sp. UWO310]